MIPHGPLDKDKPRKTKIDRINFEESDLKYLKSIFSDILATHRYLLVYNNRNVVTSNLVTVLTQSLYIAQFLHVTTSVI